MTPSFEHTAKRLAETVLTLTRENQGLRTAIREWAAAEDAWAARDENSNEDTLIDALLAATRRLRRIAEETP